MTNVYAEITSSLDGYVAGPNPTLEEPLGKGGEELHEWVVQTADWRAAHGLEGGEHNADSERMARQIARQGAVVMGRRMFSSGEGPWENDPKSRGWWGDDPPFHVPVFVLTHHPREPLEMEGGTTFTFVTDGVESAVAQAREAAGDKDVAVVGGASAIQQALAAGVVDELELHVVPLFLGGGTRLFEGALGDVALEQVEVVSSPVVTHLNYRVRRGGTS
jgi:dihydrofolate reductase